MGVSLPSSCRQCPDDSHSVLESISKRCVCIFRWHGSCCRQFLAQRLTWKILKSILHVLATLSEQATISVQTLFVITAFFIQEANHTTRLLKGCSLRQHKHRASPIESVVSSETQSLASSVPQASFPNLRK
uniref:Uncharacterized protein n=1 Tax=Spongospora subterranea TaxID=70186 RepID=A0A0H5QV00_9EUKA|eukprot:CRZ05744.1 hypothetical protein [Spongospora subterranea]